VRPNSKVILPYEPGYNGHWEMEKRRKETRDWLREREQQVRDRMNTPSIVRQSWKRTTSAKGRLSWRPRRLGAELRDYGIIRVEPRAPRSGKMGFGRPREDRAGFSSFGP
jgi:hypothetical protein